MLKKRRQKKKINFYVISQNKKKQNKFTDLITNYKIVEYKNDDTLDLRSCNMKEFGFVEKIIDTEDIIINSQYEYFNMEIQELPKNIWLLGKPKGSTFKRSEEDHIWTVTVVNEKGKQHAKTFNINNYSSDNEAHITAKKYQFETSYKLKMTSNLIMILDDNTIRVQLTKNKSMITDKIFIPVIQNLHISSGTSGNGIIYATCSLNYKNKQFHTLITNFDMVDHINGDTLDNRLINLIYTTPSLNNSNRHATKAKSGIHGVRETSTFFGKAFKASIKLDKKETAKYFSIDYHGYDMAKNLAIEFSKKLRNCKKFEEACDITKEDDIKLFKYKLLKIKKHMQHIKCKTTYDIDNYLPIDLDKNIKSSIFMYYLEHQMIHYQHCKNNYDQLSKILIDKVLSKKNKHVNFKANFG